MAKVKADGFALSPWALLILVPPLLVMGVGISLIDMYGRPLDHLASAVVQNGHAEAAARLTMLATWLLLAVAAIGGIFYCAWSIHVLVPATVRLLRWVYLGLAVAGVLLVASGGMEGAQRLVDRRVICAAFELIQTQAEPAASKPVLRIYGPPLPQAVPDDQFACGPTDRLYRQMWWLNQIQKYLLVLLIPALALGIVSCRALPASPSEEDCQFQVKRLSTHLYVTAAALVIGLLFLSALLRWPSVAFAGAGASSYKAHVDAYILCLGVIYSVFIASYYVPVAIGLTNACKKASGSGQRKATGKDAAVAAASPASEFLDLLKAAAALFAPTIAGLLGGVIDL